MLRTPPLSRWLLTVIALAACAFPTMSRAFDVPPNDGYVTDAAGLISLDDRAQITEMLQAYQAQTSNQVAILIVKTLGSEPIADVAVQVGRKWGVGTKNKDNGVLLLVASEDRQIFLATGYGLEGAVPDVVAKGIIEEEILPKFREGDYAGGLRAGIEALEKHIGGEYKPDRYAKAEGGGGGIAILFILGVVLLQWLISFLGKTKSWWLGGVLGVICGVGIAVVFSWWWSIPVLFLVGLLIDFIASKTYRAGRRPRSGRFGGWGIGGSGRGGFGGFGGGSFGGGGAGGKW